MPYIDLVLGLHSFPPVLLPDGCTRVGRKSDVEVNMATSEALPTISVHNMYTPWHIEHIHI